MRYLEEQKIGFNTGVARIPIVPAAILFDLNIGNKNIRPDAEMGYQACLAASKSTASRRQLRRRNGRLGGKAIRDRPSPRNPDWGAPALRVGGVVVGALVAVNAFGDVINPEDGAIIAGLRTGKVGPVRVGGKEYFADTLEMMTRPLGRSHPWLDHAQQHGSWGCCHECEADEGRGDQGGANGSGWLGSYGPPGAHDAGWRHYICTIHGW